ncbi:Pregnancy-induced growth inhibitor [Trichostrongylus colubriformis]|uniref:Pregnancy-induced growth inhibitor n=1 Tax=Trichostrongylus colubriformis TaxID=6319 RepID=A0AAN8FDD8_TRICO
MRRHDQADVPVIIIGNGPAGLSLSAFLSGVLPYYNPDTPHPDPLMHEKLLENLGQSLIDQDLEWCYTLDSVGGATRPLSVLYDSLVRPGADLGAQIPSRLSWQRDETRRIPHLVLGETPIEKKKKKKKRSGDDCCLLFLVVGFTWLFDLRVASRNTPGAKRFLFRLPSCAIVEYMKSYVKELGLTKNILPHTKVTSVKKTGDLWTVSGKRKDGLGFSYTAKHVVLACGKVKNRKLELPTHNPSLPIVYDILSMRSHLMQDCTLGTSANDARVVVIGDGISSADAVRLCLEQEIPVLHVMRRTERQLRNTVLSRLSPLHYGEYHSIYRLMIGRDTHPLYEMSYASTVIDVDQKSVITITTPKGNRYEKCSMLMVCIGRMSDLEGMLAEKYTFTGYQSDEDPTLFCAGSFAGDHFVRYVVGGCLDVARSINDYYKDSNNNDT